MTPVTVIAKKRRKCSKCQTRVEVGDTAFKYNSRVTLCPKCIGTLRFPSGRGNYKGSNYLRVNKRG